MAGLPAFARCASARLAGARRRSTASGGGKACATCGGSFDIRYLSRGPFAAASDPDGVSMARSSMRRVLLLAAALAIVNAPSHARSRVDLPALDRFEGSHDGGQRAPIRAESDMDARLARVEHWLKAVTRHKPGTSDDAALEVSRWSNAALRSLWVDTNVLLRLIRNPKAVNFS